jgi:hypothetical protein
MTTSMAPKQLLASYGAHHYRHVGPEELKRHLMLEIRPTCENCGIQLLPNSLEAMICSFECTFCRTCVQDILDNVCPNCGGGFSARPIRPAHQWRGGNYLTAVPASTKIISKPVDHASHKAFAAPIRTIPPEMR